MSNHEEFPTMTPAARAAFEAAVSTIKNTNATISSNDFRDFRRALSAFLREAMEQADKSPFAWLDLEAIAASLHNPPPPPPTLAEAREAYLTTLEGQATFGAFLASLGQGVQP